MKNFTILEKRLLVFLETILKSYRMQITMREKMKLILTSKQMPQRLPIAYAQVKASHNSESLLNEIRKTFYSLYESKQITEKVCNNIIKSIQ